MTCNHRPLTFLQERKTMATLHIHSPKIISQKYRILLKHKRKFIPKQFRSAKAALNYGIKNYKNNFTIYEQILQDWYDPLNIIVMWVGEI
jgi:hypothetical protein